MIPRRNFSLISLMSNRASLVGQRLKCLPAVWETWVQSLGREDPLEKEMATHSSILTGESHGRRSLVGYSPRGGKESDMNTVSCVYWPSLCLLLFNVSSCLFSTF